MSSTAGGHWWTAVFIVDGRIEQSAATASNKHRSLLTHCHRAPPAAGELDTALLPAENDDDDRV